MDMFIYVPLLKNEFQRHLNVNRRLLRDKSNPFDLPDYTFKGLFRISKELAHWVLTTIGPHMKKKQRSTGIPENLRVFTALHFFSQGSYQKGIGQDALTNMHQSSVSRCLTEVADLIVSVLGYVIKFPGTNEEKNLEKLKFAANGAFPGIVGCIDCTHVAIIAPKTMNPEMPGLIFYCRKQYYSINVQIVCNAELIILNINARFPGSVHDSGIWQTSLVRSHLLNIFRQDRNQLTYLLGDSGYPLEPWLLTPVSEPQNDNERLYNQMHKRTRNVVERTNGVLKQRFRCLLKHRVLHYAPEKAAKIIYACAILHNLCLERNESLDDDLSGFTVTENSEDEMEESDTNIHENLTEGRRIRDRVVEICPNYQ